MDAQALPPHTSGPSGAAPRFADAACGWLRDHRLAAEERVQVCRQRERRWSWARLLTFCAAAGVWFLLTGAAALAAAGCAVLLAGFAWSVSRHLVARRERCFAERRVQLIDESLARCGGQLHVVRGGQRPPRPAGAATLPPTHVGGGATWALSDQECDDLDLYASPVGIYALLNRSSSIVGALRLSEWLEHPCLHSVDIIRRQSAVRWLHEHAVERVDLMAAAAVLRGSDTTMLEFMVAVRSAQPLRWSNFTIRAAQLWAGLTLIGTLAVLVLAALGHYGWAGAFGLLALLNMSIYGRLRTELTSVIELFRSLRDPARGFLEAAERATTTLPAQQDATSLREHFAAVVDPAALPALVRRLAWTEAGGMFHVIFNVLYFYDLFVAQAILTTVLPRRESLLRALAAQGDLEALCSLACLAWEQPQTCWPEPLETDRVLRISDGQHPLIPPALVTGNRVDLHPQQRVWIITGSNMAGKSTFLRMVGVNVLLAQVGTVALAGDMRWSPVRLLTDLRIRDNVNREESYFLAEVRQVRRMVIPEALPAAVLGLIDEPFRGTNSAERVAASVALVKHLLASPHFFLVATHEQQLTELAHEDVAANFHFREELGQGHEVFDHRLRRGPATVRNALRVMEREGYPASLLDTARAWIRQEEQS